MEYKLIDLFEKYHKNNKYTMLAHMNHNIPQSHFGQNQAYNLYSMSGTYILKYSEDFFPEHIGGKKKSSKYFSEQIGGEIEEFKHDGLKYIFDIYSKKDSDIRRIFIKTFDCKSNDVEEGNCAQLTYISKSNTLNIESINSLRNCIQLKSNKIKKVDKQGTMLVYAIIDWSKKKKFKKITLEDISRVYCKDSKLNLSYSLFKVHTLQYGYPFGYWTLIKKQSFFIN